MFDVGDSVVHPVYGAGRIIRIEERQEGDKTISYYVIPTEPGATQLLVPTDAASVCGLREVIPAEDVEGIFEVLKGSPKPPPECKSLTGPLKKMDWSDPQFLAELIRDLLPVEKYGKLSAVQRKALKRAQKLLIGEICLVTGMEYSLAEQMIDGMISEAVAAKPTKQAGAASA